MSDSLPFNEKIIELREIMGWSQSELARRTGVTSSAINQLEKGNRDPSLALLRKIAITFKISMAELIDEDKRVTNHILNIFFIKWGDIVNLSDEDQKIVSTFIKRLLNS